MSLSRLEAVRRTLTSRRLDALVVAHLPHVRSLTGFSGSNALLIVTRRTAVLATDGRYTLQVRREVRGVETIVARAALGEALARRVRTVRGARLGYDAERTTVASLAGWRRTFAGARFVDAAGLMDGELAVKRPHEVRAIRDAITITERVLEQALQLVRPGVREEEIAARISYLHRMEGAEGDAFEPIVAAGARGAMPHARATAHRLRRGDLVTIDIGCRVRGYASDMTRTFSIGRPSSAHRRMYDAVLEAQTAAMAMVRDGVAARDVDAEARRSLRRRRMDRRFVHSLGHGLGLQVHELPRIAPRSTDILRTGNIITIEPGVYRPGVGGVRIEDVVLVGPAGCEVLTTAPRELRIV